MHQENNLGFSKLSFWLIPHSWTHSSTCLHKCLYGLSRVVARNEKNTFAYRLDVVSSFFLFALIDKVQDPTSHCHPLSMCRASRGTELVSRPPQWNCFLSEVHSFHALLQRDQEPIWTKSPTTKPSRGIIPDIAATGKDWPVWVIIIWSNIKITLDHARITEGRCRENVKLIC